MIPALGTDRKEAGKWSDPAGKLDGTRKQYFGRKFFGFFPGHFRAFPAGKNGKLVGSHRKKSEDFPVGILLPASIDYRCFPAETGPYFLTWDMIIRFYLK
jgi:hypothetical protein